MITVIRELHKPKRFMSRPRKTPGCSICARPFSILASIVRIAEPPFQAALAQDGTVFEYSNGEVFAKCGDCGKRRILRQVLGKYSADKPCSTKCQAATGFQCECKCAGKNHGAAHDVGMVASVPVKKTENPVVPFRPIPGKMVMELIQNRIVRVMSYGKDVSGEYVEVRMGGSYGARHRLPLTCIRRLTDAEREESIG